MSVEQNDDRPDRKLDESSFNSLLDQARDGDQEAVGSVIEQCRNYLLMVANQEMDREVQAKLGPSDIVQESMIAAQTEFHRFEGTSRDQLLRWLRGILLNGVRDSRRHFKGLQKRQVTREQSLDESQAAPSPLPDRAYTPGTQAVVNEESALLKQAIAKLPVDYRQVIQLRNWDRLAFEEIGKRMGRSDEAVRKLWTRALLKLQAEFSALTAEGESAEFHRDG